MLLYLGIGLVVAVVGCAVWLWRSTGFPELLASEEYEFRFEATFHDQSSAYRSLEQAEPLQLDGTVQPPDEFVTKWRTIWTLRTKPARRIHLLLGRLDGIVIPNGSIGAVRMSVSSTNESHRFTWEGPAGT